MCDGPIRSRGGRVSSGRRRIRDQQDFVERGSYIIQFGLERAVPHLKG